MSAIPRPLARRLDRVARAAHRFHRFAHHPLCGAYADEVIRFGRRTRLCRGCALAWIGSSAGLAAAVAASIPVTLAALMLLAAASWIALSTFIVPQRRLSKVATRFAPAFAMAFAFGAGVRAESLAGMALAIATVGAGGALVAAYRRRGPDRSPCASCPERLRASPCSGYVEIVTRERAFRRLAARALARASL